MRWFWLAAVAAGCVERFPEPEGQTEVFTGPFATIDVQAEDGRIEVVEGSAGDEVTLEFLPNSSDHYVADDTGGNLSLVAACLGDSVAGCGGGFVLTVPANQEVHTKTGLGQIAFRGSLGGVLSGQTTSGKFEIIDLGPADLTILTGTGGVDMTALDTPQSISIDTGSAPVSIEVPAGGYALDVDSNGEVTVAPELTDDASGPPLRVHSGTGDIHVLAL
ncbi:MAG: hypothetical protein H6735_28215 [Alphaproteobacteria bacterium]|nr:hypothetical protein [Alphaproteobacteria bacterium]